MKNLLFFFLSVFIFSCVDGPEIIDCFLNPPITDTVCVEIYEPVCGCNNITYDNECYAKKSGISFWVEGECLQ